MPRIQPLRGPGVPPLTPLGGDDAVLDLLQVISRRFVAMTASALVHLESQSGIRVTLPEYRVLVLLNAGDPRRPSELADDLEVSRSAIAQILSGLQSARFISRRADRSDRRSSTLALTAKGSRVVKAVLAERERKLRPALRKLSARDRRALGAGLARFDNALSTAEANEKKRRRES